MLQSNDAGGHKNFWRDRGWIGRLVTVIVVGLYFVPILLTVSYFAALTKLNHWLNGKGPSPSGDAMSMVTFYGALTLAFVIGHWLDLPHGDVSLAMVDVGVCNHAPLPSPS
jgi:hypothetical protein